MTKKKQIAKLSKMFRQFGSDWGCSWVFAKAYHSYWKVYQGTFCESFDMWFTYNPGIKHYNYRSIPHYDGENYEGSDVLYDFSYKGKEYTYNNTYDGSIILYPKGKYDD